MGPITYCVMCLGTEVKMYVMNLKMICIYNDLISSPHNRNVKQLYACYECAYMLCKYGKFKTKCCKVYNILYNLIPEPFKVTEEFLKNIDRKQMNIGTTLTSLTLFHDYQPKEQECELDEQFNIEKVKADPEDFEINNDNDKFEIKIEDLQTEEQQLDIADTPENDIDDDYQFVDTFKVESRNYNTNTGRMLLLTIQSKDTNNLDPPVPLEQSYFQDVDNDLDDYTAIDNTGDNIYKLEGQIESDMEDNTKSETNKEVEIEFGNDEDDKEITIEIPAKEGKKGINARHRHMALDSKLLNDHMTVIELTPEEAQREFLLRKESSNYTWNRYKCDLCYRGFISKTSYDSHLKKHNMEYGSFQCDLCKLCFTDKVYLTRHRLSTHARKYSCKMCPYVCFSSTQCRSHIMSHTGTQFTCTKCGMEYRFRNSLLTHMHLKHSVECVCDFCGSTFASARGLFYHKRIVHRQEKNESLGPQCVECDVHFASELAWKRHRVLCSRHEVEFGCRVCGEEFENSDSLKKHGREHGDSSYWSSTKYPDTPKTCKFCKVRLPDKTAYRRHVTAEHPNEITKGFLKTLRNNYVCEICGRACPSPSVLALHQRKHSDERPYSCHDCGKTFKYKEALLTHSRIHSNEFIDKYQCDLCGRHFSDKGRLSRHIKGHMGMRPFSCADCNKTFMFRCDWRTHYKYVHEKQPYPKKNKVNTSGKKITRSKIQIFDNI